MARLRQLGIRAIRDLNYLILHEFAGIIPSIERKSDRDDFLLKDLQYANLSSRPSDPPRTVSRLLRAVYHSAGFDIADVTWMLDDPEGRTMDDLAKFIRKNHLQIWPEDDA